MAGQKGYYGNVLSTSHGAVLCSCNVQLDGTLGTTGTRILNGKMWTAVSVSSTASGSSNAVTLQLPEKYSAVEGFHVSVVQASATDGTLPVISAEYSATTGQITVAVGTVSGATFTGSTSPNVTLHCSCVAVLGS